MTADQSPRDDAMVLAALPASRAEVEGLFIWNGARCRPDLWAHDTLQRLKRANLARYVRETKRWERVI
ncbi:hypothetical protein Tasa_041_008 [Tanticharoenia sakaeratensis NBRC 103193]|uniref:Uncharacterized protein n=1 Tax=Tanticharoenia sakaeratensis NBRC 103193 TaxID=1231623 RepID=A0A0D6MPI8_9PROT|nr:hypothetical protein Tasa_041_008 [Tanticharoenia sakaeratensis NBRC 103193]GBQ23257.1 hypothetical protein AA103193_2351 [Tanticharoenia sakaeratensis NBRC 103193]